MKFFNLSASQNEAGEKVLDVSIMGDIDPGWFSDDGDGAKSAAIAAQLAEHADAAAVNVRINSRGGDTFGGVTIYNLLREHPAAKAGKLTLTVEGLAASAASIIAMAGRTVMQRGSMMMIHNPWTIAMGGADDLRKTADTLDAIRDSLVTIYQAKTGKKPAELRALLDAETWFSAEDAKRHGFADEIEGAKVKARAEGETIFLNSVGFPRAGLPAPILAMAVEEPPVVEPPPLARIPLTRERIAAEAPALLAALLAEGKASAAADLDAARAEGHAAGVAAERARLAAIDEIADKAPADLVTAAKYGEAPGTAETLAVAALKAQRAAGADLLAARRSESAVIGGIRPPTPEINDAARRNAEEEAAAKDIAAAANRRRGG